MYIHNWEDGNGHEVNHEELFNKLGVQIKNSDGTYRYFADVLDDLSVVWQKVTKIKENDNNIKSE